MDDVEVQISLPDIPYRSPNEEPLRQQRLEIAITVVQVANPFKDIEEPVAWQREIRKDKVLFGSAD